MMADMQSSRENSKYLPGVKLDENITCVSDAEAALKDAAIAVYVVPAQSFRSTFEATNSYISDDAVVVNCSKGIEQGTLMRISEIAEEIRPDLSDLLSSQSCQVRHTLKRSERSFQRHSFQLLLTLIPLRQYRTCLCQNSCAYTRTMTLSV